ncbi:MAG: signal peptidase II [Rhodospirillaceae bacterium]|nr:signal peptidase II [Rhodospirillaceae bacterium]HAA90809.1 signal peptidase II [Rhodospirillaceae bacterium]
MLRRGLTIAAAIAVLDQLSKWIILLWVMQPPARLEVTGFFNLVLVWNSGVSFGFFQSDSIWGPILLGALTVGIIVFLFFWLKNAETRLTAISIGLVMGGALGNLVDRIIHGAVVDFLDFHAFGYHWPAFNVADSAITVGVVIIILESLFERREKPI